MFGSTWTTRTRSEMGGTPTSRLRRVGGVGGVRDDQFVHPDPGIALFPGSIGVAASLMLGMEDVVRKRTFVTALEDEIAEAEGRGRGRNFDFALLEAFHPPVAPDHVADPDLGIAEDRQGECSRYGSRRHDELMRYLVHLVST